MEDTAEERAIEERLKTPVLLAALLTIPAVAISEAHPGGWLELVAVILNWGTWLVFLAEFVLLLRAAPDKRQWLRHHPLELVIVFLTPPVLPPQLQALRVFRLLRLVRLVRLASLSREVFSLEGLGYASLLAVLTIFAGGAVFKAFESGQHLTEWQSTYWAITTMTTVGSDIYPQTVGGQITASVLVIVGIGFVALLTGAIAQRFFAEQRS